MTVRDALTEAADALARAGVPTPQVDAELLVGHVAGLTRSGVHVAARRFLGADELARLEPLLRRRAAREPLAYVLGEWGFRRLTLRTDARALVPRPETEVVVERCLALLRDRRRPRVLDLGTGTGAIALAIADEHPEADVTAVDVSAGALELARENARRTGIDVRFRLAGLEAVAEGWDLVVSNPPYVRETELGTLEPEVHGWEPRVALVGDGFHAEIARAARTELLVLEVGDGQAGEVADVLRGDGYRHVTTTRDLTGVERVVDGRRGG